MSVKAPAGRTLWWHVATSEAAPKWQTADGRQGTLDNASAHAPTTAVLIARQQGKPIALGLQHASADAQWRVTQQHNGKWTVLVCLPSSNDSQRQLTLTLLAPSEEQTSAEQLIAELNP